MPPEEEMHPAIAHLEAFMRTPSRPEGSSSSELGWYFGDKMHKARAYLDMLDGADWVRAIPEDFRTPAYKFEEALLESDLSPLRSLGQYLSPQTDWGK